MNRYLLGSLLGGLALLAAFGSGVFDWAAGLAGGTSGVRVAQQSTATSSADAAEPLERAGQLIQRQSAPTAAAGQNTSGNQAANQSVSNPANNQIAQGQPNQTSGTTGGATGGTTGGTTGGAATGGTSGTAPVGGTPAPANLESIPALW